MDCFGTAVSMSLQYGVPLDVYVHKFSHTRFEPQGFTKNPDIKIAKSLVDYIFRWLGITFLPGYRVANKGIRHRRPTPAHPEPGIRKQSLGPPPRWLAGQRGPRIGQGLHFAQRLDRNGGQRARRAEARLETQRLFPPAPQ